MWVPFCRELWSSAEQQQELPARNIYGRHRPVPDSLISTRKPLRTHETFIVYNPDFQKLEIHESYTRQKDGTRLQTPANAFVEVLPAAAANAPAYNQLKEMVVVHTGLELGATIVLDYSIVSKAGYLPELDVCCPVKELSPIKEFTFRLNVPAGKSVHYAILAERLCPAVRLPERDGMKSFTWTLKEE